MGLTTDRNRRLYDEFSRKASQILTRYYSTSFSLSIQMLDRSIHEAVYAIYGFVRLTDESVDTFTEHDRQRLITDLKAETYRALDSGLSMNPILHSFQKVVNTYDIDRSLIEAFFLSMEMDLEPQSYRRENFNAYVFGSAEAVGLMCLKVFCDGDPDLFRRLEPHAKSLGAAFQKVNFLRDMRQDGEELQRSYFPQSFDGRLTVAAKRQIESEIEQDFEAAREGIRKLPRNARFGVYLAYTYYRYLFETLKSLPPEEIHSGRIRISNGTKIYLLAKSMIRHKLDLV